MRFDGGCLGGFARLEDIIFEAAVGWVWKGAEGDEVCGLLFLSMGMDRGDGCEGFGCTFFAKAILSRRVKRRSWVLSERLVDR